MNKEIYKEWRNNNGMASTPQDVNLDVSMDETPLDNAVDVDVDADDARVDHAEYKERGNKAYKSKDYRAAIAQYTLAIDGVVDTPEADAVVASYYSNRAAALSMILQYDDAIEDCDAAIAASSGTFVKAHFRKARTLTILGRLDEALQAYSLGMIHDPNNATAVKDKEEVRTVQRRYQLAKELSSSMNNHNNNNNKTNNKTNRKKDSQQILRQMEIVLKVCPSWKEALFLKTKALYFLQRTDEAYALTTTLVRQGGIANDADLILLRAQILFQMGNTDDALKHLRQILGGDPDNKDAFQALKYLKSLQKKKSDADNSYKARNYEKAVELYNEAIAVYGQQQNSPNNQTTSSSSSVYLDSPSLLSKLYFNCASSHANLRQHDHTIDYCTRAIEIDPSYLKAVLRRAASHVMLGEESNLQQALRDYGTAKTLLQSNLKTTTTTTTTTSNQKELQQQMRDIDKKIQSAQIQLKRAKSKDFYKILNVSRDATEAEIRKSYRKLALKWHPDRHANSSEQEKTKAETIFRDVNLAYEVLSDPAKKQRYDDGVDEQDLDNPHAGPGARGHGGFGGGPHGGIDPNIVFEMFMRQQSGMGGHRGGGGGGGFHFG